MTAASSKLPKGQAGSTGICLHGRGNYGDSAGKGGIVVEEIQQSIHVDVGAQTLSLHSSPTNSCSYDLKLEGKKDFRRDL